MTGEKRRYSHFRVTTLHLRHSAGPGVRASCGLTGSERCNNKYSQTHFYDMFLNVDKTLTSSPPSFQMWTWRRISHPDGGIFQPEALPSGHLLQKVSVKNLQFPGTSGGKSCLRLPHPGVPTGVPLPGIIHLLHHPGPRGGGRRDPLLPGDRHCGLVRPGASHPGLVSRVQVPLPGLAGQN